MELSTTAVVEALKKYDNQTGPLKWYFLGEHENVATLRSLQKPWENEKARELNSDEIRSLAKILIETKPIQHKNHDDLFNNLSGLFEKDKLNALNYLHKRNILNAENCQVVLSHQNPVSAAKALVQFDKYASYDSSLNLKSSLLNQENPYDEIKKVTATSIALKILKNTTINTIENEAIIMKNPAIFASLLKKFVANQVVITQDYFTTIDKHDNKKSMGLAILTLEQYSGFANSSEVKNEVLKDAFENVKPFDLVAAYIILDKDFTRRAGLEKYSFSKSSMKEYQQKVKQSYSPIDTANIITGNAFLKVLENSGFITYNALRTFTLFKFGQTDPIGALRQKINESEENLNKHFQHNG